MKRPNLQMVLFNGAGIAMVLTVAGYMVTSFFTRETTPPCSAGYPSGQQFSLQNSRGGMLSPIEMQANVPTREWGLLRNSRVVESKDRKTHYLQVALEATGNDDKAEQNGVGFVWQPASLAGAKSACLSYKLFIPKDFAFQSDGYLPGLFAAPSLDALDQHDSATGFSARVGWQKSGDSGVAIHEGSAPSGKWIIGNRTPWPTGRWVDVQEEVRFNQPGKANGLVRLWIDGELKVENHKLELGASEDLSMTGIVSDIHYLRGAQSGARLTISPFMVQWQ